MLNHKLLGKKQNHLNRSVNYDETRVSFEEISTSPKTEKFNNQNHKEV